MQKEKKTFYIIATTRNITGIGAIWIGYIAHTLYAIDNGYIPIIDLKHYQNQYFKDNRTYKDNTWEYFFEQPCTHTLNDIDEDSKIIISTNSRMSSRNKYNIWGNRIPINSKTVLSQELLNLKSRYESAFKLSPTAQEYVKNNFNNIIGNETNILGILCRGTDYIVRRSFGEPIQPKPEIVIKKAHEFLKKHPEIKKIYLATEDNNIYETFKKEFGDKLLDNKQYRYTYNKNHKPFLSESQVDRPNHNYKLALEYLSSLYILSKCKYFIGGRCGGTIVAWLIQNSWQDLYIWKLGHYGRTFKERIFSKTVRSINGNDHNVYSILGIKIKVKTTTH